MADGIFGNANGFFTPERSAAFQALGLGLSQLGAGQQVNLSQPLAALQKRQQDAKTREQLEGLSGRFTPDQQAILATMSPAQAAQIIAQDAFRVAPVKKPLVINGQLIDPDTNQVLGDFRTPAAPKDDRTALIKNYEFAAAQGFPGTITEYQQLVSPGQTIEINTGAETSRFGAAPKGTVWALDENGNNIMEDTPGSDRQRPVTLPLAGTPAEGRALEVAAGGAANQGSIDKATDSIALIDSIIESPALAGITGMLQGNLPPITQAGTDLSVKVNQLQGQAFLQAFESLKGGGSISEREGAAATDAIARLNRAQSTEAYTAALKDLKAILKRGISRAGGAEAPALPGEIGASGAALPDFSVMTDEQLDAFIAQGGG